MTRNAPPLSRARTLALTATAVLALAAQAAPPKGDGTTSSAVGVINIDQAKADAGGITPGDAPGFPITISQPGSYRLMSNLTVPDLATTGIHVTSPGVRIDLNGFELRGPNACTGSNQSLNCTSYALPSGSVRGDGIRVQLPADSPATVAVENGSVRGFGGWGLRGVDGGMHAYAVRRLQVSNNGYVGVERAILLSNSVIDRNGTTGITWSYGVTRNTVTGNRSNGIYGSHTALNNSLLNGSADASNTPIE